MAKSKKPLSNVQSAPERQEIMARLVVKSWTDPSFKKRLLDDPASVLEDEGLSLPPKKKVKIVFLEDTEDTKHFVIPTPPQSVALREKDLILLAAQRLAIQLELF